MNILTKILNTMGNDKYDFNMIFDKFKISL